MNLNFYRFVGAAAKLLVSAGIGKTGKILPPAWMKVEWSRPGYWWVSRPLLKQSIMDWFTKQLYDDYGKRQWKSLAIENQLLIINVFSKNYLNALEFVRKNRNNAHQDETSKKA